MNKKLILGFLAGLVVVGLASCGGSSPEELVEGYYKIQLMTAGMGDQGDDEAKIAAKVKAVNDKWTPKHKSDLAAELNTECTEEERSKLGEILDCTHAIFKGSFVDMNKNIKKCEEIKKKDPKFTQKCVDFQRKLK